MNHYYYAVIPGGWARYPVSWFGPIMMRAQLIPGRLFPVGDQISTIALGPRKTICLDLRALAAKIYECF